MRHFILHRAPMAMLTTLVVFLVVCSASVDNRASSAPSHRKPPFNGSIFGKRSGQGAVVGFNGANPDYVALESAESTPIEILAQTFRNQEPLIKASMAQCLTQQLTVETQELCSELLNGNLRRGTGSVSWFNQLQQSI